MIACDCVFSPCAVRCKSFKWYLENVAKEVFAARETILCRLLFWVQMSDMSDVDQVILFRLPFEFWGEVPSINGLRAGALRREQSSSRLLL